MKSFIKVKAVDKAGNERIVEIPPKNYLRRYKNLIWLIVILIGVFVIYLEIKTKHK